MWLSLIMAVTWIQQQRVYSSFPILLCPPDIEGGGFLVRCGEQQPEVIWQLATNRFWGQHFWTLDLLARELCLAIKFQGAML